MTLGASIRLHHPFFLAFLGFKYTIPTKTPKSKIHFPKESFFEDSIGKMLVGRNEFLCGAYLSFLTLLISYEAIEADAIRAEHMFQKAILN